MAHDTGRDEAAKQHFQRSLDLASVGGDSQLTAHVMGSMSHLALHRGHPAQAISLACQGQEVLAQAPLNPALAARLLAMQARGLAALPQPDSAACGKVLLSAEQALDDDQTEPPSPWTSRFDEGSLASEAARSLRQLGQFGAAARQAQRIIEIRPGDHARSRAFGLLLLADVLVAQGEPEAACAAGHQVLDATRSLSSYLVVQQLRKLAEFLTPYRANHVVAAYLTAVDRALRDRLRLYSCQTADGSGNGAPGEPNW
jgi:tetratricopeptide (TPR) repeat protein